MDKTNLIFSFKVHNKSYFLENYLLGEIYKWISTIHADIPGPWVACFCLYKDAHEFLLLCLNHPVPVHSMFVYKTIHGCDW